MSESANGPWLSIVTVVKDDPEGFSRTLNSIAEQDLTGVEFVVIDGSTDTTAIPAILRTSARVKGAYSWHEPRGIYQAMNQGLAQSSGAYVYFANAGDTFFDAHSVGAIRALSERGTPSWMFGQVCFVDGAGAAVTPPVFDYEEEKAHSFSRGRFPPHQGTIASRSALTSIGGFDTSYRIGADYAAFLRLSLLDDPAVTPAVLATFYTGGLSSSGWRESLHEFHRARTEILKPTGTDAARERLETALQFTRMGLARLLGRVKH